MIWVILATGVGLALGALLSRPALKATTTRLNWKTLQPSDSVGGLVSAGLIVLGLASLFFCFGTLAGGLGAIAGAIGAAVWSTVKKTMGTGPAWLRAAQGASAGVVMTPLILGLGLALASLGGPLSGNPELWRDLVGHRAFPAWAATIRSGKLEYRYAAMTLLRRSGARAAPIFIEAVTNDAGNVRSGAADGLGDLKPVGAFEKVVPLLADSDGNVRTSAARALEKLNDPRAITTLLEAAGKSKNPSDPSTFAGVVRKLPGGAESARACVLGKGGCAENEDARFGAIKALDSLSMMESADQKPVLHALRDPSPRIRKAGLDACGNLFRQWSSVGGSFYVSLTSLGILTAHNTPVEIDANELIAAAAPLLEDKDRQIRMQAAIWVPSLCEGSERFNNIDSPPMIDPDSRMPRLNVSRLTPMFLRMLKNPDRDVAGAAARALAFLGDRRAIPALKERDAAENSTYNCVYCAALEALGVGPLAHSTTYPK